MAGPIRDPGHIPGPVCIDGVAAVRLFWELPNGKTAYNVLHGSYVADPNFDETKVNNLFTGIKTGLTNSGLLAALDTETRLAKIGCRDMQCLPDGVGFGELQSTAAGLAGTAAGGSPLPFQISFVVSLKSVYSRQANRGRMYIPGFNTGAQDTAGKCQEAVADNAVEFVQGIKSAFAAAGLSMCIAHPARQAYEGRTGVNYPARPSGHVTVENIVWRDLTWDTQRLRSHL